MRWDLGKSGCALGQYSANTLNMDGFFSVRSIAISVFVAEATTVSGLKSGKNALALAKSCGRLAPFVAPLI